MAGKIGTSGAAFAGSKARMPICWSRTASGAAYRIAECNMLLPTEPRVVFYGTNNTNLSRHGCDNIVDRKSEVAPHPLEDYVEEGLSLCPYSIIHRMQAWKSVV